MSAQFSIRTTDSSIVDSFQSDLGLPRFVANTLVSRGIVHVDQARHFLHPNLDRDWLNPYSIPGMAEVADAVEAALRRDANIVVFGDFDLDGISATTVLTRALRKLGARVEPFIPRRFDEGYAITEAAIDRLMSFDPAPDFVVTVDCGIACRDTAALLCERGVELVVTDHHEPSDLVPQGIPVADPKIDPECPSSVLAGVGVALKLVQILGARFGMPHLWQDYTDFATLGTVADLMPMLGENRALVSCGMARINEHPRPCIAALLETAGVSGKEITSTNLSFSAIPRLNAAGRMGDAQLALDLLMTDDFEEASRLALQLEGVNDQRRSIEAELSEIAKAQAAETYHGERVLVVAGEGWHEGVKGIVASRLVNIYGVPALLFTIENGEARGSGRSVGCVSLFQALESVSDLLTRFGGHDAAVGVTMPEENLPEFTRRMDLFMQQLPSDDFHPMIEIDACVDLAELTLDNVAKLDMLAPFGQENPAPCFLARNVTLTNCRAVGAEKNHFSCALSNGHASVSGIMFHCTDIEQLMSTDSVVNAAFQLQIDEWRGRRTVKAMLQSLSPARMCSALEKCLDPEHCGFVADLYATSDVKLCADCLPSLDDIEAYEAKRVENRRAWEQLAQTSPELLQQAVVKAIIGDGQLHDSQKLVLDSLNKDESTLAVMATGRGKSLAFQVHSAIRALRDHQVSIFVYPLRALIADQHFHLSAALNAFGVSATLLTGETPLPERLRILHGMMDGSVDVVLTTPEFLHFHAARFAMCPRIGFVVVDEAHHIGQAHAGNRMAYASLGQAIAQLGNPTILACTATATSGVAEDIMRTLPIRHTVYDSTSRENLVIGDRRNLRNRDDYLANLVATGEKTVIYVNSREQSVALARMLRKRVPQMALMIGFYNAGLNRQERNRVEELFRKDHLKVLVATSAFGEGVNIPNIRHVVLYHLPYNEIEFNQMSGRAGRDGSPAVIHLLYGKKDALLNEGILQSMTPEHAVLAQIYRHLRNTQRKNGPGFFMLCPADLALISGDASRPLNLASVECGLAVFRELGLIETRTVYMAGRTERMVHVIENAARVELTDSVRYREGLGEMEEFRMFRDWALNCGNDALTLKVSRPITPDGTDLSHLW